MRIDNILKDMGLGERIQDGTVSTSKIANAAITSEKLADGATTTAKIADNAVTTGKIADANVVTAKIADNAVTTSKIVDANVITAKIADLAITTLKIADQGVTTPKIADKAVTTQKLADGAVTNVKIADGAIDYAKLSTEALDNFLGKLNGFGGVPIDLTGDYGFTPIIRFFEWWSHSSSMPDNWAPRYAFSWANDMRERSGAAWRFFRGLEYMSQNHGRWYDKDVQPVTWSGWYYADNVSVVCMKNVTNAAQTFAPYAYYSSAYGNHNSASASVAYQIIDPNAKPNLGGFTNHWEQTSSTCSTVNFSISVPAGQVIIFVLKTSPQPYTGTNSYHYYNYHGFFNFNTTNNMSTNFKPHVATYRRLLQGKWD
ncbi:hypothetical protein [Brevibacillus sp. SYSU BS000544]|uniref:hypothetical protein n=1 Tax=Brevibacillus sp. SYSU BS000544 TaxID=3416443 RepID=UPI003CE470C5